MAKNFQYTCDGCGAILYGRNKGAFINKSYLQIKGQILTQDYDEETDYRSHTFITPLPREGQPLEISVCNLECLGTYIETRKEIIKNRQQQKLREEAGERQLYGDNYQRPYRKY